MIALNNGKYLVSSPVWDNGGIVNVGAVTWGDGDIGITGTVSVTNSLVGEAVNDFIGGVTLLSNGNYVLNSPYWDHGGIANVGAATWVDGTSGITGTVSTDNSLVGSHADDGVGYTYALSNGNYVVLSSSWDNSGISNAGAANLGKWDERYPRRGLSGEQPGGQPRQ